MVIQCVSGLTTQDQVLQKIKLCCQWWSQFLRLYTALLAQTRSLFFSFAFSLCTWPENAKPFSRTSWPHTVSLQPHLKYSKNRQASFSNKKEKTIWIQFKKEPQNQKNRLKEGKICMSFTQSFPIAQSHPAV